MRGGRTWGKEKGKGGGRGGCADCLVHLVSNNLGLTVFREGEEDGVMASPFIFIKAVYLWHSILSSPPAATSSPAAASCGFAARCVGGRNRATKVEKNPRLIM